MVDINRTFSVENGISFSETDVAVFSGAEDPTAGGGVAAPIGSFYLRSTGSTYLKTGAPDTAWVRGLLNGDVVLNTVQPASGLTVTGGPITNTGTLTFTLTNDLGALEALSGAGFPVRTGADTWAIRSISVSAPLQITNPAGTAGNPTIDLSTVGTPGTYASVTTDAFGRVTSGSVTQGTTTGGTGLTSIGSANQVLGVNAGATSLEYKTLAAGSNISVVHSANTVTISATGGGGAPGGANTNVQFNNSGTFGGSSAFNFISGANPVVNIAGTDLTTQLTIGGTTQTNNATVYIENDGDTTSEGLRCYFKRSTAGISGWITYDYDQNAPNIRLTDEDDDPPYVQFNTIGSGTYAAPQYNSSFGARGPTAGRVPGFSWRIGSGTAGWLGAEVMSLDSQFLAIPSGTTAQRPTPVAGMVRNNTTTGLTEEYQAGSWLSRVGVINKSVVGQNITVAGGADLINFSVPGGTLGADRMLRIRLAGFWNQTSGTGRTVTASVIYGGTTMWADVSASLATGGAYGWHIDVVLGPNGSADAQVLNGLMHIGGVGARTSGTTGDLGTDEIAAVAVLTGTSAVNSATAQTLRVAVSFSGAPGTFTKHFHTIEVI